MAEASKVQTTSKTNEKKPENSTVDLQKQGAAPDGSSGADPAGDAPEVKQAPIGESQGGGLKLTNRGSDDLRVMQQTKDGQNWNQGAVVTLRQNDTTEFDVTDDRRVVIDRV